MKMSFISSWVVLVLLVFMINLSSGTSCNETKPVRSVRSTASDNEVEFFLRQTLTNLRLFMSTGFPQFGLPPLDPLMAGEASVDHNKGAAKIKATFTHLLVYGLSNFEIRQLHVSKSHLQMNLELLFKNLTINGDYNMTGSVAKLFPIYGRGRFEAEASNVVLSGLSSLKSHSSGRLSIRDLILDMTVDKVKVHFHDLLGGGPMSGTANRIVNLFGKRIFDNAKPKLLDNLKMWLQKNLDSKLEDFTG